MLPSKRVQEAEELKASRRQPRGSLHHRADHAGAGCLRGKSARSRRCRYGDAAIRRKDAGDLEAAVEGLDSALAELDRARQKALDLAKDAQEETARQRRFAEDAKQEYNKLRLPLSRQPRVPSSFLPPLRTSLSRLSVPS